MQYASGADARSPALSSIVRPGRAGRVGNGCLALNILLANDDGYRAEGLRFLTAKAAGAELVSNETTWLGPPDCSVFARSSRCAAAPRRPPKS
jgi:hypothetical protein